MASGAIMPEVFFIGDKLSDAARHLGVLPRGMVTAQVPQIERVFPGIPQLECTRCIMGDKRQVLYTAAKRTGVNWIVLEKDGPLVDGWSGLNPAEMEEELLSRGFRVDVVDFTNGLESAVHKAGQLFDREKEAARLMKEYTTDLNAAKEMLPRDLGKKVAVFLGMVHPLTGGHYLVAEGDATFCCEKILAPMGCEDVTGPLAKEAESSVLSSLSGLKSLQPDVMVVTGDAQVGLSMIHRELAADPEMAAIPAISDHAVFALPHVSGGEPLELPAKMRQWAMAFTR